MSELRQDPILKHWVVINEKRGKRPRQLRKHETIHDDLMCYFCPGNEAMTPPEIGRTSRSGHPTQWAIRWFENKFPIFHPSNDAVKSSVLEPKQD